MATKYKSNKNIVYSCKYHIIWCPKYRKKALVAGVDIRLKQLVHEIAELSVDIVEMETDKDHIHILAEVDPQAGVKNFVKRVKGRTSYVLMAEFPHLRKCLPALWTNSYFVSTVGGAPLSMIKQYIENQQLSKSKKSKTKWNDFLRNGK